MDLNTLANTRIVDIPTAISDWISPSKKPSDLTNTMAPDDTFDPPLVMNGLGYLLDGITNTLVSQSVTTGNPETEIVFTVYTETDLAHFTLYLNLQGNDVNYSGSDTYITYTNDGTVSVTDPHDYIADATITIAVNDSSIPEKKTVTITIEFEGSMGLTNMVVYMWNTDRKASFVNLIDVIEVVAPVSEEEEERGEEDNRNNNNTPSTGSRSAVAADNSERDVTDDEGDTQSSARSLVASVVGDQDDDDDAQTLLLIRMWSGFEPDLITDAELLESLNLDYSEVDIPAWMMTELAVMVSNGDVTVKEFKTALVYMLDILIV